MNQISQEALKFLEVARDSFTKDTELTTFRDVEKGFIALRTGFRDDCIQIYELGNPVGDFTQQLPKQHKVLVDYDELALYKRLKEETLPAHIIQVEGKLKNSESPGIAEYNRGFLKALQLISQNLEKLKLNSI